MPERFPGTVIKIISESGVVALRRKACGSPSAALEAGETMPLVLVRELTQGPKDGEWAFGARRTRAGSDVGESISQPLSHEVVVRIYRDVFGEEPATGLELVHVLENWDKLEPFLRAEIEKRINPS